MKRILFFLLLVINLSAFGQVPSGYTQAGWRYKVKAFIFDSTLHIPSYNGTPSGTRNGAWVGDGAVAIDTVNNLFYFRSGGSWHSTSSGAGWLLTGNAGTTSSNFIGTTDAQPLMFRYNNLNAGSIGKSSGGTYLGIGAGENDNAEDEPNVGVGYDALYYNTTGSANSAVGASALASNTTGTSNSAVGVVALYSNTTGSNNSAVGASALASNTTGYNNSAVGASAGNNAKQKPDAKYQTLLGSSTYGTRDSITVLGASFIKETIVRGKLIDSTLSAGSGTKAVRWNSSTGEFTYADTSEVTTPTWQQTLTAGSTLTQDNTITSTGYDFSFNGQNIQFNATDGVDLTGTIAGTTSTISVDGSQLTLRNSRSGATSGLDIRADSIMIEPHLGLLKIDTLAAASSQNQLIGWTSTSGANRGKVGAVTIGTGLSLSSGTLNSVWTASGNDVYNNNSGNVGIGTTSPDSTLTVIGGLRINNGAAQNNYVWTSTGTDGRGTWKAAAGGNSVNLVFGGGSGASADTAVFTTSAIYGSFYNDADTIVVTSMRAVLQGTSPDVTYKVWYNDSLNVEAGATALVTAGSQVTNTTTGTNVTSFDATKIPPGVWVWVKTSAVTTKPTYFSLTINANR